MINLSGKRIAIISTDYFEEAELVEPLIQLKTMGAKVEVAAPHSGTIQALRGVEKSQAVAVDTTIDTLDVSLYDALIIPGGVVNADHLRINKAAQNIVQEMASAHKTIAAICHGPWLLISSGLVGGRTLTSYHTLEDDITNAGGVWVDEEVVVDDNVITSRKPSDIPAFIHAIVTSLK
ncbi:MAG TPA: type 1 glutamine amidotransferase domain-containing protein [Candidatus Saccharimonadales bacterium]|nr:type 1 glutamine amidotransferase domain-containing protein [Candidatus Saccharimonadales bacterium]